MRLEITGKIDPSNHEAEAQTGRQLKGFIFESSDRRQLVQARMDGFTFNQLSPYPSWEAMKSLALPIWDRYRDAGKPQAITRLALRYINVLHLPLGFDLEHLFVAPPAVPESLPQDVASLISRVTIIDKEIGCFANIVHSFEGVANPNEGAPITLDIDVYKTVADSSEIDIPGEFERLHEFKNRISFSSITEEAVRLYE